MTCFSIVYAVPDAYTPVTMTSDSDRSTLCNVCACVCVWNAVIQLAVMELETDSGCVQSVCTPLIH